MFDRYAGRKYKKERNTVFIKVIKILITLFLVMVGWLIFRANSLKEALLMLKQGWMIHDTASLVNSWLREAKVFDNVAAYVIVLCGVIVVFMMDVLHELQIDIKRKFQRQPFMVRLVEYWCVVALIIYALCDVTAVPQFIYNQF